MEVHILHEISTHEKLKFWKRVIQLMGLEQMKSRHSTELDYKLSC